MFFFIAVVTLATRESTKGNVYGVGGDSGSSDVRAARVAVYETLYLDGDMGQRKCSRSGPGELEVDVPGTAPPFGSRKYCSFILVHSQAQ